MILRKETYAIPEKSASFCFHCCYLSIYRLSRFRCSLIGFLVPEAKRRNVVEATESRAIDANCSDSVMGFERFEIVLENRNGIFYPGQTVIGTVHVSNTKSETIKGKFYCIVLICEKTTLNYECIK